MKEKARKNQPTLAPGIDDEEEQIREATKSEIRHGDYTKVITYTTDDYPNEP